MKTLAIMAIPLTQGLYALVDGEDYEKISKYKWSAQKDRNTHYAVRNFGKHPNRCTISMHRIILNIPKGKEGDHINHCGLDNRKQNIRICTKSQNQHNRISHKVKSSDFKGVCWHKRDKKWNAQIGYNGKLIHLGYFYNEIKAAKAYDNKAKELFGEFAETNL